MTDGETPHVDSDQVDDVMLTTGEAAHVIGFGVTRRQVDTMIANQEIEFVRHKPGAWAKIPLLAARAKRAELERKLAESKSRVEERKRLAEGLGE